MLQFYVAWVPPCLGAAPAGHTAVVDAEWVIPLVVVSGAFAAGIVAGLTGLGTALTALPIWLTVLPPLAAAPLALVCSLTTQLMTFPAIRRHIDRRQLAPYLLAGLAGVPLGVMMLPHIPVPAFKLGFGILMIAACVFLLVNTGRARVAWGGRAADAAVGFAGGVLGGLASLSGILPTLWAELRGYGKDERRAIFQGFNLGILAFALLGQVFAGVAGRELLPLVLWALPGTLLGGWLGRRLYDRLDARAFARVVLALLLVAGASLVIAGLR
jgi:uncharacterized membrane protein YfcA